MKQDLDIKLYNEYLNGENDAFEVLYNRYKDKIQYFIFNIVKDYQKAEDITQEVFIYVLQNKKRTDCSFKYYLYLVAKSKAVNYINVEKRRSEITDKFIKNKEEIEKDVIDIIVSEENKKILIESIKNLDEKYRNAIYLSSIEELSYTEISEILGVSLSNTKSLIHRGKKELRKNLIKKGFKEMNTVLKLIIVISLVTITLTGITYAGTFIINNIRNSLKSYEKEEVPITKPVSESEAPSGEIVFKTFNIMNNEEVDLKEWKENSSTENKLYYKQVNTYEKYKELMDKYTNLRTLKEEDFENYFAVVIISPEVSNSLKYKYIAYDETDDGTQMNILIDYEKSTEENIKYSGVVVIMTRKHIDYIINPKIKE